MEILITLLAELVCLLAACLNLFKIFAPFFFLGKKQELFCCNFHLLIKP